jgi:uncharacterized protein (DUF2062 family)
MSGTPHNIAAGFACGVAISFTPLVGFHILLGCVMALIVRGNFVAVAVGTLVGNPWTFPFMWLGGYELGKLLLGSEVAGTQPMPWRIQDLVGYLSQAAQEASTDGSVVMLQHLAADLLVIAEPVLVGGLPLGIAVGLLVYFPMARAIAAYQEARRRRRKQRRRAGGSVRLKGAAAPNDAGTA